MRLLPPDQPVQAEHMGPLAENDKTAKIMRQDIFRSLSCTVIMISSSYAFFYKYAQCNTFHTLLTITVLCPYANVHTGS